MTIQLPFFEKYAEMYLSIRAVVADSTGNTKCHGYPQGAVLFFPFLVFVFIGRAASSRPCFESVNSCSSSCANHRLFFSPKTSEIMTLVSEITGAFVFTYATLKFKFTFFYVNHGDTGTFCDINVLKQREKNRREIQHLPGNGHELYACFLFGSTSKFLG